MRHTRAVSISRNGTSQFSKMHSAFIKTPTQEPEPNFKRLYQRSHCALLDPAFKRQHLRQTTIRGATSEQLILGSKYPHFIFKLPKANALVVFNLETQKPVFNVPFPSPDGTGYALSHDDDLIIYALGQTITAKNFKTGEEVFQGKVPDEYEIDVIIHHNGYLIATQEGKKAAIFHIWNTKTKPWTYLKSKPLATGLQMNLGHRPIWSYASGDDLYILPLVFDGEDAYSALHRISSTGMTKQLVKYPSLDFVQWNCPEFFVAVSDNDNIIYKCYLDGKHESISLARGPEDEDRGEPLLGPHAKTIVLPVAGKGTDFHLLALGGEDLFATRIRTLGNHEETGDEFVSFHVMFRPNGDVVIINLEGYNPPSLRIQWETSVL